MNTLSPFARPLYVMVKPAGAHCNLACDYCYYLDKKKLYAKEESEIKSMQKIVEKQQRALTKQKALNEANKQNYSQLLEQQQKELGYELREIAERTRAISDLESVLQNSQTNLIAFMREIEEKATRLATLKAQYKERLAILKAEQKAAKSMQ